MLLINKQTGQLENHLLTEMGLRTEAAFRGELMDDGKGESLPSLCLIIYVITENLRG